MENFSVSTVDNPFVAVCLIRISQVVEWKRFYGDLESMTMRKTRVSSNDVAKAAGVSQATVSYVLSGRWEKNGISEKTRDAVEAAARQLGYRTNRMAQSLKLGKSMVVGVVVSPSSSNNFFMEIVLAQEKFLAEAGYLVVLVHSFDDAAIERKRIDVIKGYDVDGMLIVPASTGGKTDVIGGLLNDHWPFVLVDKEVDGIAANFVGTDDLAGARLAVEHLVALGHRHIAHVSGPRGTSTADARRQGYLEVLREHDLPVRDDFIVGDSWPNDMAARHKAARVAAPLFRRDPRPTAVFACTDVAAWGVYDAAHDAGLRIPQDLSVLGYADLAPSEIVSPSLTSVRQPADLIGRESARLLLDVMENSQIEPQRVVLPVELVHRQSTGPAPVATMSRHRNQLLHPAMIG